MDVLEMISELRQEWERLNDAIVALERLARGTRGGRGRMTKVAAAASAEGRTGSGEPAYAAGARKREKPAENPADEPSRRPPE
jgi:hypothetical protein